jgi:hypothetical protein
MKQRVARHVGNRGVVLGLLGVIWILTGIGRLVTPPRRVGLPHEHAPIWAIALMWLAPGIVAVAATAWRKLDRLAWGVLAVPVGVMFFSSAIGWLFGGYTPGWVGACVYAAVVLLIDRCAAGLDRPAPWGGEERRWTAGSE